MEVLKFEKGGQGGQSGPVGLLVPQEYLKNPLPFSSTCAANIKIHPERLAVVLQRQAK